MSADLPPPPAPPPIAPPPLFCPAWTAWVKRVGLALMGGMGVWMLWNGDEKALLVLGFVFSQAGMSEEQQAALLMTFRAMVSSLHTSEAAAEAARNTAVLKEAVKDIQDNPALPGTPGWMKRHGGPPADPRG